MTIQEKIQSQMTDAMRNKEQLRLNVLRMMKTAVKNKEIEKMKPLEENEVTAVLNTLVKQRKDSIEQFRKGGREENWPKKKKPRSELSKNIFRPPLLKRTSAGRLMKPSRRRGQPR